jgi:hypothetical protein
MRQTSAGEEGVCKNTMGSWEGEKEEGAELS